MGLQKFMDHWSYVGLPVSLDMLKEEILVEKHGDHACAYLLLDHKTLTSGFVYSLICVRTYILIFES
ncbi:hypothetical protein Hanom_Chr12g01096721 [Helianthus anomalus]